MATQRTTNAGLPYPQHMDRDWHLPLIAAVQGLDACNAVGALAVTPADVNSSLVSTSLNIKVAAGSYRKADGSAAAAAGSASYALPASSATHVWLTDAGAVGSGAAWPAADHVRLATVTTDGTKVTAAADERAPLRSGGGPAFTLTGSRTDGTALANLIGFLQTRFQITNSTSA